MAEEKDMKERLLKIARERNIAESVVNGIMTCLNDDKPKLADFLKIYEFFQNVQKDSDKEDAIPDGLENADFSTYTDDELRRLLVKLQQELEAGSVPETAPIRRDAINIRLGDYL